MGAAAQNTAAARRPADRDRKTRQYHPRGAGRPRGQDEVEARSRLGKRRAEGVRGARSGRRQGSSRRANCKGSKTTPTPARTHTTHRTAHRSGWSAVGQPPASASAIRPGARRKRSCRHSPAGTDKHVRLHAARATRRLSTHTRPDGRKRTLARGAERSRSESSSSHQRNRPCNY